MITEELLKKICDGGLDALRDQLVAELRQVNNEKFKRKHGYENEKDCGCKEKKRLPPANHALADKVENSSKIKNDRIDW